MADLQLKSIADGIKGGDLYPTNPSGYELKHELGSGATCKVYRAKVSLKDGTSANVAVKIMDLSQCDNWDLVFKEINFMRQMKHENLVNVLTCFAHKEKLWIVMPLLDGGSLRMIMQALCPDGFTNENIISCILHGALEGLVYMHRNNYIHRDIKAGNILLSSSGVPKLADFGVAATTGTYNGNKAQAHTFTGTPCWMAPEVISQEQQGYGSAADIWSLGITAMELAFGHPPYAKLLPLKAMMETLEKSPPSPDTYGDGERVQAISKDFRKFIARVMKKDPTQRPTAAELLNDPFIKKAPKPSYLVEMVISQLPKPTQYNDEECVIMYGADGSKKSEKGDEKSGDGEGAEEHRDDRDDDDGDFDFDTMLPNSLVTNAASSALQQNAALSQSNNSSLLNNSLPTSTQQTVSESGVVQPDLRTDPTSPDISKPSDSVPTETTGDVQTDASLLASQQQLQSQQQQAIAADVNNTLLMMATQDPIVINVQNNMTSIQQQLFHLAQVVTSTTCQDDLNTYKTQIEQLQTTLQQHQQTLQAQLMYHRQQHAMQLQHSIQQLHQMLNTPGITPQQQHQYIAQIQIWQQQQQLLHINQMANMSNMSVGGPVATGGVNMANGTVFMGQDGRTYQYNNGNTYLYEVNKPLSSQDSTTNPNQ